MKATDRKLTHEQREQLVRVYLESGTSAAGPLAVSMGVSRKYPGIMAATSGRRRSGRPPGDWNDHRWQWAIERGPVVI